MIPTFSINPFIPGIVFVILTALLTIFFFLNKDRQRISLKIFFIYSISTVVLFLLVGLVGYATVENALKYFILLQSLFLLLGVGHCFALYFLNSEGQRTSFWYEFVFTLYISLLGVLVFYLIFSLTNKTQYSLYFLSGFIFFIVPFFIMKSFDFLIAIPNEEYIKWYYPIGKEFEEADEDDLMDKHLLVIGYKIERKEGSGDYFTTTGKSPLRALLGDHFAGLLYEYNDSFPGKKIQYLDEYGQPQAWNFYIEPKRWYQTPVYLDPNLTYNENDVREKDVIVCERII